MVCWFICHCLSDVTYKIVHVTVCVHLYTLDALLVLGCMFLCSWVCLWCICSDAFSVRCVLCVCVHVLVTDIIWCRLVSVLRLQALSPRLIDKWIWFANVIKLIWKTAMGCWSQISRLQYFFVSNFYLNIYLMKALHDFILRIKIKAIWLEKWIFIIHPTQSV